MSTWQLYLNLGNSSAQWGCWSTDEWALEGREKLASPAEVLERILGQVAGAGLDAEDLAEVIACASIADTAAWDEAAEKHLRQPLRLTGRDFSAAYPTRYHDPAAWGQDRVANAWAVREEGRFPAVVLDAGTCLTADLFSAEGVHLGGAIAPGLPVMRAGLLASAPHLSVHLPELPLRPGGCGPGETTGENLALGMRCGLGGAAEACLRLFAQVTLEPLHAILTGGDADLLAAELARPVEKRPRLTLEGARLAWRSVVSDS